MVSPHEICAIMMISGINFQKQKAIKCKLNHVLKHINKTIKKCFVNELIFNRLEYSNSLYKSAKTCHRSNKQK